jgi:predicted phosphoribosyltransferase
MDEDDFEGTLVLEKLAAVGKVEAFLAAIDSDQSERAALLMRQAGIDSETIQMVLKKMNEMS